VHVCGAASTSHSLCSALCCACKPVPQPPGTGAALPCLLARLRLRAAGSRAQRLGQGYAACHVQPTAMPLPAGLRFPLPNCACVHRWCRRCAPTGAGSRQPDHRVRHPALGALCCGCSHLHTRLQVSCRAVRRGSREPTMWSVQCGTATAAAVGSHGRLLAVQTVCSSTTCPWMRRAACHLTASVGSSPKPMPQRLATVAQAQLLARLCLWWVLSPAAGRLRSRCIRALQRRRTAR
jgi:hypothetical protein